MDFVAREIFYLFWFSLTLGTVGAVSGIAPAHQAVLVGDKNVAFTCSSDKDGKSIQWSFIPVGGKIDGVDKPIKFDDGTYNVSVDDGEKSSTLNIKEVSKSMAGIYICTEGGKFSTLLIVLEPTCDFFPRKTNTLPCDSTLQLSCVVNYFVNKDFVTPDLKWLRGKENEVLAGENSTPSTSQTTTTTNSTLNVTWLNDGTMPSYTCDITFKLNDKLPPRSDSLRLLSPTSHHQCQPFASASSVTCGEAEGLTTVTGTDDKGDKAKLSSPRSANTNNLAILGVAGVLLLAQLF